MGQTAPKEAVHRFKRDPIQELKDVTLRGVVPLNEELGRGAYGCVFTVKYRGIVRAAKRVHPILLENVSMEETQRLKDDFIRECLCCSSIQHPNIVQFVGVYYPSAQCSFPVMVMELMSSSLTLFVKDNKSKITFSQKISLLHDVSLGLNFLHNHKPPILHRDLSPNNVMLTKQLVAKIGDLGVAKVVRADDRQTKSKLTTAPGTVHFMPPEALVEDNPVYGTSIDVFSFGGIVLHVFSEEWPTPSGQKMMDPVTKRLIAFSEAERRQQYLDKMTSGAAKLRKVVEQCLNDDPDERPSIQEVSIIIESFKEDNRESGFIPLSRIQLDSRHDDRPSLQNESVRIGESDKLSMPALQQAQSIPIMLEAGSAIQFGDPVQYGTIKRIEEDPILNREIADVETEDGKHLKIPLEEAKPENRFNNDLDAKTSIKGKQPDDTSHILPYPVLEVGSMVQFGNPVQYGVIKNINNDSYNKCAVIETENNQLKKIPFAELQPDNRFIVDVNRIEGNINPLEKEYYTHEETLFPVPPADKFDAVKHTEIKGIQGYKNSCYLDATLYGMFAFCDAFDILILEDVTTNAEELDIQKRLKSKIVYPLRKKGIVVQESVEEFREHLAELQNMKGLTSEKKDPEEFLNILFKHVLHLDPFITISRPSGIDKEFFVQLFVEPDKDEPAVNTQRLLSKMFREQNISFAEYPTRLLLQIPRYGKRFKSFQRIIPSLELNVTSLCITSGLCSICKRRMGYVCIDCSKQKSQIQYYCNACSLRWHQTYYNDQKHEFSNNDFDTGTLQLLSVLCIETSHYVCFTRITGSDKDEWVFFDSMAERQDNGYNLPKVTHCTDQLQEYVYSKKDIGKIPSKKLPELVRRFVEDAYLCIYIDRDGVMYQ